jgi:hypothetical protein
VRPLRRRLPLRQDSQAVSSRQRPHAETLRLEALRRSCPVNLHGLLRAAQRRAVQDPEAVSAAESELHA